MPTENTSTYFVIPLSIQEEEDGYLVGSSEIDEFYQFPEEGVRIIEKLKKGDSVATIKIDCASELDEEVDVEDFLDVLLEVGFIYRHEDRALFDARAAAAKKDGRLLLQPSKKLAQLIFSRWALAIYLAIVGYAVVSAIQEPRLRLNLGAFYLEDHFTLTLLALLVLYSFTVALHEFGHILAAAQHGISSRLGIGHRLWMVVAEADLTGILSLPKKKRYFPLLAGMLTDVLTIALLTILLGFLLKEGVEGYAFHLIQALILQVVITLSWQFHLFLRTDLYYVLCNYYSYPNLDEEARNYLRDKIFRATKGRLGSMSNPENYHNQKILRNFSILWVFGRALSMLFLFLVFIPTIWRYIKDAYNAFAGSSGYSEIAIDLSMFALISLLLFATGMYMWLKRR